MHRLAQEDKSTYEFLISNIDETSGAIKSKIKAIINLMIDKNTVIVQEAPAGALATSIQNMRAYIDVLDTKYFNLVDIDDAKADEYFYAARLVSAKAFIEEDNLCDAVYELIHAFDEKEKIKQDIKDLIL